MRPHDDFLEEVTTAIRRELANCAQLRREALTELGKTEPNPRVLGSIMHDFYHCCERVFRRIGAEINGTSYRGDAGHLLFRMTVAVPNAGPRSSAKIWLPTWTSTSPFATYFATSTASSSRERALPGSPPDWRSLRADSKGRSRCFWTR